MDRRKLGRFLGATPLGTLRNGDEELGEFFAMKMVSRDAPAERGCGK
jgi:hypothetical protein